MATALIVLAIGSVVAGWIGLPAVMGGSKLEAFLAPSFHAHARAIGEFGPAGVETPAGAPAAAEAHGAGEQEGEHGALEWELMAVSVGAAFAGLGIATFFWLRNRPAADNMARSLSGPYRLLLNKYYVDELYDGVIVNPIKNISTVGLWKGADAGLIDGAVNGVGAVVRGTSGVLRRLQTGSIRTYAASLFLGVVLILGWYLLR
jgi:NADH-quinone oxidoreductase subunit L